MVATIATLLDKYPDAIKELAFDAQRLLLATLPGVEETVDLPAKMLAYGYGSKYADSICTIILSQKGIKIGFYKGTELPDPKGLLEGSGKVHKYVQINKPEDTKNPALKALLLEALNAYKARSK